MRHAFDANAGKKPTNVTVNADLLKIAKECGINLSATLEQALIEQVKIARREQWLKENEEAISAYNEHVAKHGVFSDGSRSF